MHKNHVRRHQRLGVRFAPLQTVFRPVNTDYPMVGKRSRQFDRAVAYPTTSIKDYGCTPIPSDQCVIAGRTVGSGNRLTERINKMGTYLRRQMFVYALLGTFRNA